MTGNAVFSITNLPLNQNLLMLCSKRKREGYPPPTSRFGGIGPTRSRTIEVERGTSESLRIIPLSGTPFLSRAESARFELANPCGLHAFQACAFGPLGHLSALKAIATRPRFRFTQN